VAAAAIYAERLQRTAAQRSLYETTRSFSRAAASSRFACIGAITDGKRLSPQEGDGQKSINHGNIV
jgi:hypothetical protein